MPLLHFFSRQLVSNIATAKNSNCCCCFIFHSCLVSQYKYLVVNKTDVFLCMIESAHMYCVLCDMCAYKLIIIGIGVVSVLYVNVNVPMCPKTPINKRCNFNNNHSHLYLTSFLSHSSRVCLNIFNFKQSQFYRAYFLT